MEKKKLKTNFNLKRAYFFVLNTFLLINLISHQKKTNAQYVSFGFGFDFNLEKPNTYSTRFL